jgi:hypothetical protein
MKKTTTKKNAKQIANEAWYMLPNDCKVIMKDLKKSFIDSLEADIQDAIDKAWNSGFSNGLH